MRGDLWAWRWTFLGAAFLLGGIVRDDALALGLAALVLWPVAKAQDGVTT